jgi:hypothetical protein
MGVLPARRYWEWAGPAVALPSLIRSGSSGTSRRTAPLPPSDGLVTPSTTVGAAGIAGGQQQVRLRRHLPGLARMQGAVQQDRAGAVPHRTQASALARSRMRDWADCSPGNGNGVTGAAAAELGRSPAPAAARPATGGGSTGATT